MGRLDYLLRDQHDDRFQQGVQSDLDMLVLETMYQNTRGRGQRRGRRGRANSGWRNRGMFFWVVLILSIYWFILRPLGL